MSDLVARLHGEASEPHRVEADLFREAADRIEALEAELANTYDGLREQAINGLASIRRLEETRVELAEANAKIAAIRQYASEHLGWNEKHGSEILRVRVMCGPRVSPQDSLAGSTIHEKKRTTNDSPKKCEPTCVCKADWADGTGVCQECGLMRDEETA